MSVTLFEPALRALLDTENGPVGLHVQRVAAQVKVEAQRNVRGYFGSAPSLEGRVDEDIDFEMEGSSAVIGIKDGGNKARRIAAKQADGTFNWLTRALEAVRSLVGV